MGKRELKKQHKDINLNVIDLLANLDPTEGNKFLPFLVNKLKAIDGDGNQVKRRDKKFKFNPINSGNRFQNVMSQFLLDMVGGSLTKVNMLNSFEQHMVDKRIDNTDITTYNSWKQIEMAVEVADIKLKEKELKASTEEIFKSDEWLVIRPLSFESSKAYGANTKWCTTMEGEKLYFYKYCKGGLIYVINRTNGEKFGFYNGLFDDSNVHELTVWDALGDRIDSLMADVPLDIMYLIKEAIQTQNHDMLSDSEKENYDKWMGGQKTTILYEREMPLEGIEDMEMESEEDSEGYILQEGLREVEDMEDMVVEPLGENLNYLRAMLTRTSREVPQSGTGIMSSTMGEDTSF